MTTIVEAITEATNRVGSNTELLQQITTIAGMALDDEPKIKLLNGIGAVITPAPTQATIKPIDTTKTKSPAQDPNIRVYQKSDTGNLVLKGAVGVGRSFGTLSRNVKTPQLAKQVFTSNSLPMQLEFSDTGKFVRVSYTIDKLSADEIAPIQKFLADLEKPQAQQPPNEVAKDKSKVSSPKPAVATGEITQEMQMTILNEAQAILKNGLAKTLDEALAKAKQARGIA